jgi:hypothetical protein
MTRREKTDVAALIIGGAVILGMIVWSLLLHG